jgi:NAD(P)-dependent dehydrogenase (short-subunit alcohol dehydrogenase family)
MKLKDKVAIITGAKSGIGFATASRFMIEGAKVVLADINEAHKEIDLLKKQGADVRFVQADVSKKAHVDNLIEQTMGTFGRLDIMVNNVGIDLTKKITETTETEWDRIISVNLKSVYLCSKAAISVMRYQKRGVIVNVASELGLVGGSEIAAYSASKGGVVQLTKSMAIDHAVDGIRVNCVAPGPISTPLLESIIENSSNPEEERQSIIAKTILKRLGRPEEIANVILFMASDESSYMVGSVVVVDGGWTAQ